MGFRVADTHAKSLRTSDCLSSGLCLIEYMTFTIPDNSLAAKLAKSAASICGGRTN
jgi:hypothetical protein